MSTYVVTYDLIKRKNYPELWEALTKAGARRIVESVWTLETTSSTVRVRDHFKAFIDSDDQLVVFRYDDWATFNALAEPH